jgi:hypothetical protein
LNASENFVCIVVTFDGSTCSHLTNKYSAVVNYRWAFTYFTCVNRKYSLLKKQFSSRNLQCLSFYRSNFFREKNKLVTSNLEKLKLKNVELKLLDLNILKK